MLKIMNETVCIKNGHCELRFPIFPDLPNNKPQVEQQLSLLKKLYHNYTEFMNDLLKNDYAQKVTSQEPGPLATHWYLHIQCSIPKNQRRLKLCLIVVLCTATQVYTN